MAKAHGLLLKLYTVWLHHDILIIAGTCLLTNRYLNGIPEDSRIAKGGFLKKEALTEEVLNRIKALNEVAAQRGQTLAEMALAWVLKDEMVTSVIIGASSVAQLADNLKAIENTKFTAEELETIQRILD